MLIHKSGWAWCGVSYALTYIGPQLVKIVLWVALVGSHEIAVQVVVINQVKYCSSIVRERGFG